MTKQHFVSIARIIKLAKKRVKLSDIACEHDSIDRLTIALAVYFKTVNAKFDEKRFLQACGIESN